MSFLALPGRVARRGLARMAARWRRLGARACRHALLGLILACLVIIAHELGGMAQALRAIAQAQAISAYAVMRQLQGSGLVAARGLAAPAATAIDPHLLAAQALPPGVMAGGAAADGRR